MPTNARCRLLATGYVVGGVRIARCPTDGRTTFHYHGRAGLTAVCRHRHHDINAAVRCTARMSQEARPS